MINFILKRKIILKIGVFILPLFISYSLKSQETFINAAFNAVTISSLGNNNIQKATVYLAVGKSNQSDVFKDSRFNYGIAYDMRGAKKSPDLKNNDPSNYNITLHYGEVFVSGWVKMKSVKAVGKMNLGYLFNSVVNGTNYGTGTNPEFRKLDLSISGGAGTFVGTKLFVDLTASTSVFPIKATTTTGTAGFSRGPRNIGFSVGLSYLFFKSKSAAEESED